MLEELPDDLKADDVVFAITSSEFDGLNTISWGLLLSEKFIKRFFVEIEKKYNERKGLVRRTEQLFKTSAENLMDGDASTRRAAIDRLASTFATNSRVPVLIAQLLIGKRRDSDASVRLIAAQKLVYLAASSMILEEHQAVIHQRLTRMPRDDDDEVQNEVEYLQSQLNNVPSLS